MALLPPIENKTYRTPKPCYFAEHRDNTLIRRGQGQAGAQNPLICGETEADVDAEIGRLGLQQPKTNRQKAAEFFQTLPAAVQQQFMPVFEAVSAIENDGEAANAVEAVTVPDALKPLKARLVALLRGNSAPTQSR